MPESESHFLGLPDLGALVNDAVEEVTKHLPPVVGEAIQGVLGKILDPNDSSVNPGDPQPPGTPPIPVAAGSGELNAAVKAIDAVNSALNLVLKLGFLIPNNIETIIRELQAGLMTIRGWLD